MSKAWDSPRPSLESGITAIDNGVNNYLEGHYFEGVTRPAGHFTDITTIAAAAVIAGIAASVCLLTSPKTGSSRSDSLVVRDCIVEDGCEGIGYKLVSSTYEKNNISIRVKWTNKRKEELYFGEEFKLFKTDGDTACTQKKAAGFAAAANIISPGGSKTEIYNLSAYYDIEPGVQYRLEKTFYLKSANDKKYKAYIVFKAGEALAEYMPEKAAYTEPLSDYTNDNIPQFKVDNFSFSLLKKEPASSEWEKIDGLQSVRLKKSEFDKSFSGGVWIDGLSAQKLRRDNLHAFTAFNTDGRFYYLLEQKNGDVYIAKGSQLSEDFSVNWLFKMKRTDENGNMSLGELQNAVYPSGGSNRQEQ